MYMHSIGGSGDYINYREVVCRLVLEPGHYCVIPSTFKPNIKLRFMMRIFTEKPILCTVFQNDPRWWWWLNFKSSFVSHLHQNIQFHINWRVFLNNTGDEGLTYHETRTCFESPAAYIMNQRALQIHGKFMSLVYIYSMITDNYEHFKIIQMTYLMFDLVL